MGESTAVDLARHLRRASARRRTRRRPGPATGRRPRPVVRGRRGRAAAARDRGPGGAPGGRAGSGRRVSAAMHDWFADPADAEALRELVDAGRRAGAPGRRPADAGDASGPLAGKTVVVSGVDRGLQPRGGRGRDPGRGRQARGLGLEEDGLPRRRARGRLQAPEGGGARASPCSTTDGFRRLLAGEQPDGAIMLAVRRAGMWPGRPTQGGANVPTWTTFPARRGRRDRRRLFERRGDAGPDRRPHRRPRRRGPGEPGPGERGPASEAPASPIAGGLLDKVAEGRQARGLDRPELRPAVRSRSRTAPSRASTSTSPPRSPSGSASPSSGAPQDWAIITAGGWSGRWDASVGSMTITTRAPEGPRLQRPVLLHARPDGGQHRVGHHDPRGHGRQDRLRRRGDHVPRLARGQDARLRHAVADHDAARRRQGHDPEDRRPVPAAVGRRAATTSRAS